MSNIAAIVWEAMRDVTGMKDSNVSVLIVGRGYLGTLFSERLRVGGLVIQRASESISPVVSTRTLLWATGPGSSDALGSECARWQQRIDYALRSGAFFSEPESVILISSAGTIYGECMRPNGSKESDATIPLSEYASFQARVEEQFSKRFPEKLAILRVTNPYGPRRLAFNAGGVISKVVKNAILGDPLTIFGDGYSERDYIFEEDLASVLQACVDQHWRGVFNIGLGRSFTLHQVIAMTETIVKRPLVGINFRPDRSTDLKRSAIDITKLRKTLPNLLLTDLESGLEKSLLAGS